MRYKILIAIILQFPLVMHAQQIHSKNIDSLICKKWMLSSLIQNKKETRYSKENQSTEVMQFFNNHQFKNSHRNEMKATSGVWGYNKLTGLLNFDDGTLGGDVKFKLVSITDNEMELNLEIKNDTVKMRFITIN